MAFVDIPIELDVEQMKDDAVAYLQAAFPGWEPAAGDLETILIEAVAEMAYEQAAVAAQMPTETFRQFGLRIANLQPVDGQLATGSATFTMTDTLGHTIPAGTFLTAGDVAFETSSDVTAAIGESTALVPFQAVDEGTDANGLTGAMDLVDTIPFVDSVVIVGATADGVDAETDDDYLARLVEELQLMAPRPIVPQDFEVLARRIAGVDRAAAVDGYNPGDDTYDNERMVAIAAVDADGEAVSSATKAEVVAYLDSLREANFVVNGIDPVYTAVDVTASVSVLPGFDAATVLAQAIAQVTEFLQPYTWGKVSSTDGHYQRAWVNTNRVGYLNVAEVIKRADGVAFVESLTVAGGTSNVTLPGAAPLTRPGTIAITQA